VKNGLYAVNFGGGQVDITNGKFVFSASEAYMIENGKISYPVKGATLIGNGPDVLNRISMIGNDMRSIRASACAARKARACRSASASRRCAWMA
jgi:predicted Zn-dependent protease